MKSSKQAWRNSAMTKIAPDTTDVVINVDGNAAFKVEEIAFIRDELGDLLQKYCHAECQYQILSSGNEIASF